MPGKEPYPFQSIDLESPHLCGGKSALALCKRVSTPITRFSAGRAKPHYCENLTHQT